MAKVLLIVPPLTGHINPLLSVAQELIARGHVIAWAGHQQALDQHVEKDACCFYLPEIDQAYIQQHSHKVRGLESIQFFYQHFFFPLAKACVSTLENIVIEYQPDLLICDHQMVAGALVARKTGVPWVTTITTSASILRSDSVLDHWLVNEMMALQQWYGLQQPLERPDFSPFACIVFSSEALIGEGKKFFDAPFHFVGPAIHQNRKPIDFPWHRLDQTKRKIFVSLGTVSRDRSLRFYQVVMEALAKTDLQVIMVAPDNLEIPVPNNFIICERVPQLKLLPHVDVVISHAGHNTVCEALSHAKPMLLAPIRDDQPVIASQVVEAGAGISVRFGKVTPQSLRTAVETLLNNTSYRQRAEQIQQSFLSLKGEQQAVSLMELLLAKVEGRSNACG